MRTFLLITVIVLNILTASGQTDTLFWFAAPEVTYGNSAFDRPVFLRITSYSLPAAITISQPANSAFTPQLFTVPPDSLATFDLTPWIDNIENKPADNVLNYGLKISSSNPVSIYYEVVSDSCRCNPEIFVLKGQNALGNNFLIPSQNLLDNNPAYSPVTNSSFDIVSTQNGTSVTITPSHDIIGHTAGIPFNITLNQGQTYSAMAMSNLAGEHLQGSKVISSKQIAITIKDDVLNGGLVYGTCSDLGGDQIIPVRYLGNEYIAINGRLDSIGDQVFVLATGDSTIISQNGNVIDTLNTGETLQLDVGDSSTYIQSSSPVYVLQLSGYGCETGIDILPQIICTGSFEVALSRSTPEDFYVNLLVPAGGENSFLAGGLSGIIDSSIFRFVPGTGGQWIAGQTSLSTSQLAAGSSIIISNSAMPFHLSVIHGGDTSGTRFGYFSNFACPSTPVNYIPSDNNIIVYPNPANSEVNIEFTGFYRSKTTIRIFDSIGRLIIEKNYSNETKMNFDLRDRKYGLYLILIETENGIFAQKIIIN